MADGADAPPIRTITYRYGSREYTAHIPTYWRAYHTMADIPDHMPRAPMRTLACTKCNVPGMRLGVLPEYAGDVKGKNVRPPNYDITYTSKTIA